MDEANATRVSAAPDESAPERGGQQHELKTYAISINVESTMSGKHLCGLVLDTLQRRGHQVNRVQVRPHVNPLATYARPGNSSR